MIIYVSEIDVQVDESGTCMECIIAYQSSTEHVQSNVGWSQIGVRCD